jgi:pantoate--beta-alanine ligase
MSSRNIYLDISERQKALCLYQSLLLAKKLFNEGEIEIEHVKNKMAELIDKSNGIIDYIAFVNNNTFNEVKRLTKDTRALLAVKIGRTRLIDNMLLGEK